MDDMVSLIKRSASRDVSLWSNHYFNIFEESQTVRDGFHDKIAWMDEQIQSL
jgi:hypothetical protein